MTARILDWKALSADYARYHTHPMNRLTHAFGIPMIVFCVVRWTQLGGLFPWAALALPLYAAWDLDLALVAGAIVCAMAPAATHAGPALVWTFFAAGWALQLLGHAVFEKKSPAFAKNLLHLLVGPFWILGEILGPESEAI